jgi:hypothetical protein
MLLVLALILFTIGILLTLYLYVNFDTILKGDNLDKLKDIPEPNSDVFDKLKDIPKPNSNVFDKLLKPLVKIMKRDTPEPNPDASDALSYNLKDPLVTSRAYFTEPRTGSIGDFVGYSPVSQDDWLHRFSHEEPQDKSDENDDVDGLVQVSEQVRSRNIIQRFIDTM